MKVNYFDNQKWYWMVPAIQSLDHNNSNLPFTLRIDLTTECNFACPFCLYQSKASAINKDKKYEYPNFSKLNHEKLLRIIELFAARGLKSTIITGGGEPMIYPRFFEVLDVLFRNRIEVGLITNGTRLNASSLKQVSEDNSMQWVRISLDAAKAATWKKMHIPVDNSSFNRIIGNVRRLVELKNRKFLVALNFLITPANYQEILPFYELAKELGVDNVRLTPTFTTKGKDIYSGIKKDVDRSLALLINKTKPLVKVNLPRFEFMDTPNRTKFCWFSSLSVNLGVDSRLYPCCLKKYVQNMGTPLHPDTFEKDMNKYFQKMSAFNAKKCQDCMYHEFNDYAQKVSSPGELDHFVP